MGIANARIEFNLGNIPEGRVLLERLFRTFFTDLVDPKQITISRAGYDVCALDGSLTDPQTEGYRGAGAALFPTEQEIPGTNLTKLGEPGRHLSVRDRAPAALREVLELIEIAKGFRWASGYRQAWVEVWGLTHVYYMTPERDMARDWFLREKLLWADGQTTYHPILRIALGLSPRPSPSFSLLVEYESRLWSRYGDPDPNPRARWPTKQSAIPARANCNMLAERVADFVSEFRESTLSWADDSSHRPPIQEFLVPELERRIGPQGTKMLL